MFHDNQTIDVKGSLSTFLNQSLDTTVEKLSTSDASRSCYSKHHGNINYEEC
jgi:hypothetical protein